MHSDRNYAICSSDAKSRISRYGTRLRKIYTNDATANPDYKGDPPRTRAPNGRARGRRCEVIDANDEKKPTGRPRAAMPRHPHPPPALRAAPLATPGGKFGRRRAGAPGTPPATPPAVALPPRSYPRGAPTRGAVPPFSILLLRSLRGAHRRCAWALSSAGRVGCSGLSPRCPCRAPAPGAAGAPGGTPLVGALATLGTAVVATLLFFSATAPISGAGHVPVSRSRYPRSRLPGHAPPRMPANCRHFLSRAGGARVPIAVLAPPGLRPPGGCGATRAPRIPLRSRRRGGRCFSWFRAKTPSRYHKKT